MTIVVNGPNGVRVQFPDGTDGATIDRAMRQVSGASQEPPAVEVPKPIPDKYQQAAIDENKDTPLTGYTRRLAHGATLGADNTLLAAALTPFEMIKRGTLDPSEAYNYAKAREDYVLDKSRENTGALGTAAEVLGGGVSGVGLASGGLTTARMLGPNANLAKRTLSSAADAAGFGAFTGAMEGNGLAERGENALKGAGIGAVTGGIVPPVLALGGAVASPIISNIRARQNPRAYAEGQVARGIQESGVSPNNLSLDVIQAGNEGQAAYTLADAMGNSGQRMLSTVARAPGEGRTAVVQALEGRQADQGRRVAGALSEGFDAPQTAAQAEARMTAARKAEADREFSAVRTDAQPVDTSRAVGRIDETLAPYGVAHDSANDSTAAALARYRRMIEGNNDFNAVQRVRGDLADDVQQAFQSGAGNKGRLLKGVLQELDNSLETASEGFKQANRRFSQASRDIEAVQTGRDAAMRGRTEDTIPAFRGLGPEGQQAFRTGYADPLVAQAQGSAFGVNKARPFTSDAFRDEAAVIAPRNDMMQRRLGRENTMFETRNQALGGSRTADNLADAGAMGVEPKVVVGVVRSVLTGNIGHAVRDVLSAGQNILSGNTAEVRRHVAEILLQRAPNMNAHALQNMVDQTINRIQHVQNIARSIGRGGSGAVAVGSQQRQ